MTDLEKDSERQDPSEGEASTDSKQEVSNENDSGHRGDEGDSHSDEIGVSLEQTSPKTSRFRAKPLFIFILCLGVPVGFGLGQVGHDFQVNRAKKESDAGVQGKGTEAAGACKAWADTICEQMGSEQAYECTHARAASALLSGSACADGQKTVLAKIEALKAGRVECDELFSQACSDLGPEGKGCEFAMTKAPTFSSEECQDMKRHYNRVLAKLMKRQAESTLSGPARPPGEDGTISIPN